uniref:NADH dehydrogenase subunit 3 n=1 Tax=Ophiactis savignyi TaxID=154024 RepID=UPI002114427C|nr:NADH dehydrogenase subunit 3 [Ophiactis savignyi]USQ67428.1 NADH dehydrogenase subunit 3 [Ophiactis savignyi]
MSYLFIYIIIALLLASILSLLGKILPVLSSDLNKIAPYECGFDPINSARAPFSFRFFMVAILFLIFDLEIALLIIVPFTLPFFNSDLTVPPVTIFIIILVVGLWYEWANGGLEWAED